jgi:sugar phosphate isomerase/epimerase
VNRRSFLETLAALGAVGVLRGRGDDAYALATPPGARLKTIGLQLYTVRGEMARDFEGTLARVAATGYREVEFAGYFDHPAREVRAALDRHGLKAPSAHIPIERLRENWHATLADARVVGHQYLVMPWIPEEERRTLDGYKRAAELFNKAGAEARSAGIQFGYHNHNFEFEPIEGQRPYDVLLAEADPTLVAMEMDLYWITKGGGDPLAYFARWPGRFPMVHVKDAAGDAERTMVDVGRGTIDWKRIFARRKQAGIRHFFVEHDQPADPFASIRASYEYLKHLEF